MNPRKPILESLAALTAKASTPPNLRYLDKGGWLRGVDLTGLVVDVNGGRNRGGFAITPRLISTPEHDPDRKADVLRFVTRSGVDVFRTVLDVIWLEDSDIALATLVDPLPPTITPVTLAGPDYVAAIAKGGDLPIVRITADNEATIMPAYRFGPLEVDWWWYTSGPYQPYSKPPIDGDSGRAAGVVDNGDFIVLGHTAGDGGGPLYWPHLGEIQGMAGRCRVRVRE